MAYATVRFTDGFCNSLRANEFDAAGSNLLTQRLESTGAVATSSAAPALTTLAFVYIWEDWVVLDKGATTAVDTGLPAAPGTRHVVACAPGDKISILAVP